MGIEGIIRPPPEIRAVADKTAIFVAKNGRDFEKRILNSAKGKTPKFAFLHDSSPFHAYYEDRIVFYANGGSAEEEKKKNDEKKKKDDENNGEGGKDDTEKKSDQDKQIESKEGGDKTQPKESSKTTRKAKSIVDPVAKSLLAQRAKIKQMNEKKSTAEDKNDTTNTNEEKKEKSKEDETTKEEIHTPQIIYTTPLPPKGISQCQLEIIKTTAQFTALNHGDNNKNSNPFLHELTVLEWQNPIYGFLQPRHAHYAYFTQLVDIYIRILQRSVLLHEQNVMKNKDHDQTSSLLAMASLKRMVGMDNVDFAETTNVQLRQEIQAVDNMADNIHKCLDYAAYQAEYDRFNEEKRLAELEKMMNEDGGNMLGGSSRVDWHDFVVVETIDFPVDEVVESLPPPPPPLPPPPTAEVKKPRRYEAMDMDDDDDDNEAIKVVGDYTPKVVSAQDKFSSESRTHVIDPITKRSIPIADMSEHMRIQLLDPKWAAEKERFMEKQKDSNLVGGDMIARNVDAFTKARGDMFGSSAKNSSQDGAIRRSEATSIGNEQSVGPQPIGDVAAPTQHARPPMEMPDAKRVRVDDATPMQLQMPPPIMDNTMQPPIPPPPGVAPPAVEENDTETAPTKLSETDFADSLPNPMVNISIIVPNDSSYSSWNFNGQTINISIDVMTKIKGLKQKLQPQLGGMPVNKMQLKSPDVGFLKDAFSLAKLNIASHSPAIELVPKVRGGRK